MSESSSIPQHPVPSEVRVEAWTDDGYLCVMVDWLGKRFGKKWPLDELKTRDMRTYCTLRPVPEMVPADERTPEMLPKAEPEASPV